jgi:bifunctional DNA-binding transcriptional regulator/antitoxin component of YhaV-PrlF toxin-antitoxin module
MSRRALKYKNIRNIQKNQSTYYVSLPIEAVRELGWKERQKVVITKRGKKLIIEDWKS